MSKLLINEYPILVLPSLAKAIGLNEAIVLQQVHYWLENPKAGVVVDGHKWVHNTYQEWQENFPFWSIDTVRRTIGSLERMGLLISAQTAPNPFDKTKSYRVDYQHPALLDEGKLHTSITETTVSDTNNTASGENQPSVLPLDWQIAAGAKEIVLPDERDNQMRDAANLIATGMGSSAVEAYELAYAFMRVRGIIIPASKAKGQRKTIKEMLEMGVTAEHVADATRTLMDKKLTVVDLFSVAKTAIALATPAPSDYDGAIEGI